MERMPELSENAALLIASLEASVLYRASIADAQSFDGTRATDFVNKDRRALIKYVAALETQAAKQANPDAQIAKMKEQLKKLRKKNKELRAVAPGRSYILK
ncbi:hypothetical protein [Achromobacter phage Motura]|uniref:Uncharacterized protein n=1 Tax=Achromobacter phage Motura TaxID=2591403 RepID=A0A514CSL4_9CAUD|nr:hypothetical protein H1O15_gp338 [Achromobacter phage Motura]QDH83468.1 hypothetical protein [Achromobacter phage Motura]